MTIHLRRLVSATLVITVTLSAMTIAQTRPAPLDVTKNAEKRIKELVKLQRAIRKENRDRTGHVGDEHFPLLYRESQALYAYED